MIIHNRRNIAANKDPHGGAQQHNLSLFIAGVRVRVLYTDNNTPQEVIDKIVKGVAKLNARTAASNVESIETFLL